MPRKTAPTLTVKPIPYQPKDLKAWQLGRHAILERSSASRFIKNILCGKAKNRPGTRFFGEACVASTIQHEHGWYGSFKWLTSPRYVGGTALTGFAAEFAAALNVHFDGLERLQERAARLSDALGFKPMPPDLWLIANGKHHFIEVKLPWDSVSDRQLAGMALLAKHLRSKKPVELSVAQLYPAGEAEPEPLDLTGRFRDLYKKA